MRSCYWCMEITVVSLDIVAGGNLGATLKRASVGAAVLESVSTWKMEVQQASHNTHMRTHTHTYTFTFSLEFNSFVPFSTWYSLLHPNKCISNFAILVCTVVLFTSPCTWPRFSSAPHPPSLLYPSAHILSQCLQGSYYNQLTSILSQGKLRPGYDTYPRSDTMTAPPPRLSLSPYPTANLRQICW